ncbi:MAG: thermosome subunit alpha [Candidatus Woesearchaeota archaeon]
MSKSYEQTNITNENTKRSTGRDAQRMNILAARLVAETVRTTLGPKGMDKMLVDSTGEITVTNDGVTILKELNTDHPAARMVIEIAKTQEEKVGDGTTTAVILAGELLKRAEELLNLGVHPTIITKGYRLAKEESIKILNAECETIKKDDEEYLIKIAQTAITGKGAEDNKELLSKLIVKGLIEVGHIDDEDIRDNISVKRNIGESVSESELIKGVVIDKEKTHPDMPSKVKDAKILLLDTALEIKSTASDAKVSITSPEMMQSFIDTEERLLKSLIDKVKNTGANVVFCQKGIDDLAQYFLAKEGIYATRRVKRSDMNKISKATGAKIISDFNNEQKILGAAGLVEQVKTGDDYMTIIRECKNPKSITLLIKGTTSHVAEESARAVDDAIGDVATVIKTNKIVSGAGSIEAKLAQSLREYAKTLKGREQLAAQNFADSFEIIPKILAENAGLDSINTLAELKHAHSKGEKHAGIDVYTGKIIDALKNGIIEPLNVKAQAIISATEVATMILRIDDVILTMPEDTKIKQEPDEM